MRVRFLSGLSQSDVRHRIGLFRQQDKEEWRRWVAAANGGYPAALPFRRMLQRWQAVRARIPGRVVRYTRSEQPDADLHIEDLLSEAAVYLREIEGLSLRELRTAPFRQTRALRRLWDVFRDLPTIGEAKCVGITKAVKLLTLGRIGPALDSVVRQQLALDEPRDGEAWVEALVAISLDLRRFERREHVALEKLVESEWQPVSVGRAYDMVAIASPVPTRNR